MQLFLNKHNCKCSGGRTSKWFFFNSDTVLNVNSDVRDEYVGQGLDCGEGWLCLRGLPYSCRVVLCWEAEQSTSLGTTWLWSQPLGMTKRGMMLANYRRGQAQWEPWVDINGLLCLLIFARSLLGINTTLTKWRVLLPLPASPAQWVTCVNKEFPYYPLQEHIILWWAAAEVLLLFPGKEQVTPLGKPVSIIHFTFKENRTPEAVHDLPGWCGESAVALGVCKSWAPGCFFSPLVCVIHQQGLTRRTRVIVT